MPKTNRILRVSLLVAFIAVVALSDSQASSSESLNSTSQQQPSNNNSFSPSVALNTNSQKPQTIKNKLNCSPSEVCVKVDKKCTLTTNHPETSFDLRQITNNVSEILVPNFIVDGKEKSMILGLCHGLDASISCEGKKNNIVSACLLDGAVQPNSGEKIRERTKDNSEIVGFHVQAKLRYSNESLYYESHAPDKISKNPTCTSSLKFKLGTSLKFFCAENDYSGPKFVAFVNCTYNFEWGSRLMCPEKLTNQTNHKVSGASKLNATLPITSTSSNNVTKPSTTEGSANSHDGPPMPQNSTTTKTIPNLSDLELKINPEETEKSAEGKHQMTLNDSTKVNEPTVPENITNNIVAIRPDQKSSQESSNINSKAILDPQPSFSKEVHVSESPAPVKMNKLHKFFMISLIIVSLASFIVVIFVLDNKTRLGLPLNNIRRRARQAFQPQPVPYSRVDDFNDSLDL